MSLNCVVFLCILEGVSKFVYHVHVLLSFIHVHCMYIRVFVYTTEIHNMSICYGTQFTLPLSESILDYIQVPCYEHNG